MIQVTRFNGSHIYLNVELIQFIEATPDTVVTLTTNVKVIVKETPEQIIDHIVAYRRRIQTGLIIEQQENL